jgi:hypothetical protein
VSAPPKHMTEGRDRFPRYRLLTGLDDEAFCHRVSDALALGYELYGAPVAAATGERVTVGQALVWPGPDQPPART